jgi:hypothetical protein
MLDNPSISAIFQDAGIPQTIWGPILRVESGGNPLARALTPYEDSVGLFQLNRKGGLGSGYTVKQLEDPTTNASIAAKAMAPAYNAGVTKGLEGLDLLRYVAYGSGWPTMQGVKALAYDPVVQGYDTKLIKAAGEASTGSGSTRSWEAGAAEIVSSDSKIAKIFFIALGGALVLLGVKVLTDVPLVVGEGG